MTDQKRNDPDDPARRDFLNTVTTVVAGAGVAATAWPFIQSMNPTTDVLSKSVAEVDLSRIQPGEMQTVSWQGKPVFILRRTPQQIEAVAQSKGEKQPEDDKDRAKNPEWLVVVGLCTHLGCVPTRKDDGWFCPCHGSVYDNSGRILRGPAPRNLEVPPYEFVADNAIVIGKPA